MWAKIKEALCVFGGKQNDESDKLMRTFFGYVECIDDDPFLFREPPYYYAMCILHHPVLGDDKIEWYHDPELWPPPKGWSAFD